MALPIDPDTLLTRKQCAACLTEAGYVTSPATLDTKASRGGGPPYSRFGRRALYRWGNSLAWAQSQLTPPVTNASEASRQKAAG
jgi:hypothetical protein